ncbi:ribonuclease HI [Alkalibacter mobilis]|uniref:ribonuclease HI n=1 Tax=Alkalibacter mobilis TaxID=2787712 RepID=UPI00189F4E51|nr:ribonuclease HI [Alkalibacter mobilis]MBF7096539.1 ribonuclease HI [Alkalibacter mobilis]
MKEILIYTDGGCRGNDASKENLGGIGIVMMYPHKDHTREIKKGFRNTTNNQMELLAVITGLKMLKEKCDVKIYSDSAYVVNAFNQGWVKNWKQKNWSRGKSGELKNRELWIELDELVNKHKVEFIKVKGHGDNIYNNRADQLVNEAMDELI